MALEVTTTVNLPDFEHNSTGEITAHYHAVRIRTQFILMSIIIPCGLILNAVTFCVFLRSRSLRHYTRVYLLMALAAVDSVYLTGELMIWLNTSDPEKGQLFRTDFVHTSHTWCTMAYFLRYFGQCSSTWILVAITIDRFLSLTYPMKFSTFPNTSWILLQIGGICLVSGALTLYPFWTLHIKDHGLFTLCTYRDQNAMDIWTWIVIRIGTLLIPGFIVTVLTAKIIWKLRRLNSNLINTTESTENGNIRFCVEKQHVAMLIYVAMAFIILRTPYIIMYYIFSFRYRLFGEDLSETTSHVLWFINDVTYIIAASYYASNLFLYVASSHLFRKALCCKINHTFGSYKSETVFNQSEQKTTAV